jgi:hypothetical protein
MKKLLPLLFFLSLLLPYCLNAQMQRQLFSIPKLSTWTFSAQSDRWSPAMKISTLPKPHPGIDRMQAEAVKAEQLTRYRAKRQLNTQENTRQAAMPAPVLQRNYFMNLFNGFVPNDNDNAVSDSGIVACVTNTSIATRNTITNSTSATATLHSLTQSLGLPQEEFDPKIVYDPENDRFILLCLNGFNDSTSSILLGFSQTNSSLGAWNFYSIPGDPLNDTSWTDFPMMTVNDEEVFITVNLLYNDSTWQAGFRQTIIWQIGKDEGYAGQPLQSLLHYNIGYNGQPIRNLCPVKGGSGNYNPGVWLVSNRNFSAGNDTVFLVHINDTLASPGLAPTVQMLQSNRYYHMPVNADQPGPDDLIVNDARILGAFVQDDKIQFVCNTLDTSSGLDGIYHGVISSVSANPVLTGNIYTLTGFDIAYPNIAYAGTSPGDDRSVFSLLYTSPIVNMGVGAAAWDGTAFSPVTFIRGGSAPCNMLIGDERWGDYTGCQTRYSQPGYVWITGSYTTGGNISQSWLAELTVTTAASVQAATTIEEPLVYPNPAISQARIRFTVTVQGRITVRLYDNSGRLVEELFNGALIAGENEFSFNTASLPAGMYQVVITDAGQRELAKEKLIR